MKKVYCLIMVFILGGVVYAHPPSIKYPLESPIKYQKVIIDSAVKNDIPVEYLDRLLKEESGYNPLAVSYMNCRGIAQLNPKWYDDFVKYDNGGKQFDMFYPFDAIPVAAHYLARLEKATGDWYHALIAYNQGLTICKRGIVYDEARAYAMDIVFGRNVK